MVVEWKRYRMAAETVERFVRIDDELSGHYLARLPGFLGREIWHNAELPGDVVVVVRWKSRRSWEIVNDRLLAEVEDRLWSAVGGGYRVVAESVYEVLERGRGLLDGPREVLDGTGSEGRKPARSGASASSGTTPSATGSEPAQSIASSPALSTVPARPALVGLEDGDLVLPPGGRLVGASRARRRRAKTTP